MKTLTSGVGEYLSSRSVATQVFSARQSLTSVFGMGTGGPSALITPTYRSVFSTVLSISYFKAFVKSKFALVLAPLDSTYSGTTRKSCSERDQLPFIQGFLYVSFNAPSGIRTRDPLIKSQLLYQLS